MESHTHTEGSLLKWHFLNEQEFIHQKSDACGKFRVSCGPSVLVQNALYAVIVLFGVYPQVCRPADQVMLV